MLQVRIYEVDQSWRTHGKAAYSHAGPALSVCWSSVGLITCCLNVYKWLTVSIWFFLSQDGMKVLSGGVDGAGHMLDITTGLSQQVAEHDAPIKAVRWINSAQGEFLATAGWDKMLRVSYCGTVTELYMNRTHT